jgi:His-Xaa-Ser system radical SAM maturase HxsC
MLKLSGIAIRSENMPSSRQLLSLSTDKKLPFSLRQKKTYLARDGEDAPSGFKSYLSFQSQPVKMPAGVSPIVIGDEFNYLDDKDIISLSGEGRIRSLFRANSHHNSILLTEQCNNYCLMCSQPPKDVDDRWLLDEAMETIRLIPRETQSLGITGGEPTLFGDGFIDLIRLTKNWLPNTGLHILSNGRTFLDINFTKDYADVDHPDLMVGIPVYSADPSRHDYVVQAMGAFDETIRGILNLKKHQQKVEIRVVIHKQTHEGLARLAEYIARNLLFVDHVALMGLEMTGFTRANLDSLWIDPIEYRDNLSAAVRVLTSYGIKTSVYNHPLCLVNKDVEHVYVKSISDWKNEYAEECTGCVRMTECGGFFSSGIQHGYSKSIKPFE